MHITPNTHNLIALSKEEVCKEKYKYIIIEKLDDWK
jgi:hypothetical protein